MNPVQRQIIVLKLDHRPERDKRITTHVGLVARAFGASEFWISGLKDPRITETIQEACREWGNQGFKVITGVKWRRCIREWKKEGGEVIHLTMYGLHVDEVISKIRTSQRSQLIVVGGSKVPIEVFHLADYNVAIGHQPHSEVAALSVFLDRLFRGQMLHRKFSDATLKIKPTSHGKRVTEPE